MSGGRLLWHSLRMLGRHKLRSGFMMFGSFIGVGALTLVLTAGAAAQRRILTTIRQLFGPSSIVVSSGGGFFMGGPRGESARLTLDDVAALAGSLPDIEAWDPLVVSPAASVRRGEASRAVRLLGQSERWDRVWGRGVSRGELFDTAAVGASARVALIGETVAAALFGAEEPVGAEVLIGSVPFRVIGVLDREGTDIHGMDRDNEVVIPVSTAMRRVLNVDSIRAAKLLVRDPDRVDATAREVTRLLRERHGLAEGAPADFTLMTSSAVQATVARVQRVIFVYLPLVAAISLLAGGALQAALMLSSVNERVAEIGLRRAVGASTRDIRAQFLAETAVTALGGASLGIVAGSALALGLASRMNLDATVSPVAIVVGLALAAVTGLLAGVAPARRAARLEPARALR